MIAGAQPNQSPEARLLLACARGPFDAQAAAQVAELLARPIDWATVLDLAQRHRIVPLLYEGVRACAPWGMPAEVLEVLQRSFMANLGHNRFRTGEMLRLIARLARDGIRAVPLKGAVLAEALYGTLALRSFGDLDLLVREHDAPRARAILIGEAYAPVFEPTRAQDAAYLRYQHHYVFVRQPGGIVLELHYRLREHYFSCAVESAQLWARLAPMQIGGQAIATLSPEDTLLALCVHGASHCWERLVWICDIAAFLHTTPALDWQYLRDQARALGSTRMLGLGLALAQSLLGAPLPAPIEAAIANDRALPGLVAQVAAQLFGGTARSFRQRIMFHLQSRERWRDRARYCLRLALTPTEGDWRMWALPEPFLFVYYLLRPLRLAATYGRAVFARS